MLMKKNGQAPQADAIISLIRSRSENLFETKQLMCSEAVIAVLNQSLDGGLSHDMAVKIGSGLSEGIGGSGCACGALSGGVITLGLFLGRKTARTSSKILHDDFKKEFGATCCRVLTKKIEKGSKAHFESCTNHTGWAAARVAELILQSRPELVSAADTDCLEKKDTVIRATMNRLFAMLFKR